MIMKPASVLAKQHGLERYLDSPAELNAMIFRLMLLQEAIQHENVREKKRRDPAAPILSVTRAAGRKFVAVCGADEKYRYAVETALRVSTDLLSVFHRSSFVKMLTSMGIPADKINEYCESVIIEDDTHCIDRES